MLSLLPPASNAGQLDVLHIDIKPHSIKPGDAFTIIIRGVKDSDMPQAWFNGSDIPFGACGDTCLMGIGGVSLETRPGTYDIDLAVNGEKTKRQLSVEPSEFETIRLTLPDAKVTLSPEDMKRVEQETERLNALWSIRSDKRWEGGFIMPLENELSTAFGVRRIINNKTVSIHRGLDIRGKGGEPVRASNTGTAVLVDELFYGGNTVILDHGLGIYTVYMHLSAFNVKPGDVVSNGAIIGYVGSTGRSSGPHLHFGIKIQGLGINPLSLLWLKL